MAIASSANAQRCIVCGRQGKIETYSLRPKISVVFAFREITLTKYIVKNINIYNT